ncbi:MAG TPA: copper chaperone PCu(A)C [Nitrospirota bacterium]|nr:copper chaperone PCu(A)C [Nitrospirota bacterium]
MKIYFKIIVFLIIVLFCSRVSSTQEEAGTIVVHDAWVRALPPSVNHTAAYMTVENRTTADVILRSAGTIVAKAVEIHKMEMVGDMMVMSKVDELRIPAREQRSLQPNGFHLMIISLLKPLEEGDTVPIVLYFKGGSSVAVQAIVHK